MNRSLPTKTPATQIQNIQFEGGILFVELIFMR